MIFHLFVIKSCLDAETMDRGCGKMSKTHPGDSNRTLRGLKQNHSRTVKHLEKRGLISCDEESHLQLNLSENDALARLQAGVIEQTTTALGVGTINTIDYGGWSCQLLNAEGVYVYSLAFVKMWDSFDGNIVCSKNLLTF